MGHSLLKHKGCGGNLYMSLSKMFIVKTPSVSYTVEGIFIGTVELTLANSRKPAFEYNCEKCRESIQHGEFEENIEIVCMACRKNHSIVETSCFQQITAICDECVAFLSEKNTEIIPDYLKSIALWIKITKDIKLKPYSEILKLPIQL